MHIMRADIVHGSTRQWRGDCVFLTAMEIFSGLVIVGRLTGVRLGLQRQRTAWFGQQRQHARSQSTRKLSRDHNYASRLRVSNAYLLFMLLRMKCVVNAIQIITF